LSRISTASRAELRFGCDVSIAACGCVKGGCRMKDQNVEEILRKVVRFAPQSKDQRHNADPADPLEQSGHSILALLHRASHIAKDECDRAVETAENLAAQIRAAEARMNELEHEAAYYRERAQRAEKWLTHISREIESRFFESDAIDRSGSR